MAQEIKEGHLERTANEPRDPALHNVTLKSLNQINDNIRIFRLEIPDKGTIKFLPGQWLDVYIPGVPKAGGFTITSPPSRATPNADVPYGYLELAVQKSPDSAAAIWLWQDEDTILDTALSVRVGGSFVWPPPGVLPQSLRKVVFVAGGVGINPLMSMLSALADQSTPGDGKIDARLLYSMKDPPGERMADGMLFMERIATLFAREQVKGEVKMFLTGAEEGGHDIWCNEVELPFDRRRITTQDVAEAIGEDKRFSVVYVCGVPSMTDEFVKWLSTPVPDGFGMEPHRILCEKWW